MSTVGTLLTVNQTCPCCQYWRKWSSQPSISGTPAGNLLLSAAIMFTGNNLVTQGAGTDWGSKLLYQYCSCQYLLSVQSQCPLFAILVQKYSRFVINNEWLLNDWEKCISSFLPSTVLSFTNSFTNFIKNVQRHSNAFWSILQMGYLIFISYSMFSCCFSYENLAPGSQTFDCIHPKQLKHWI